MKLPRVHFFSQTLFFLKDKVYSEQVGNDHEIPRWVSRLYYTLFYIYTFKKSDFPLGRVKNVSNVFTNLSLGSAFFKVHTVVIVLGKVCY